MRSALVFVLAGCVTEPTPPPEPPVDLLERAWEESIEPGDAIVAVPGTSTYSTLSVHIEAAIDADNPVPTIDGRTYVDNVEVLEAAIAAAERSNVSPHAVELAIWGAGITKTDAFHYISLDGHRVTFRVIGGTSVCAIGGIAENLPNYNAGNADRDARDLYQKLAAWRPGGKVTLVAHSWGGIAAEYLASHFATYIADHGPGANVVFVAAGGVPGYVPMFKPHGRGFRTVTSRDGEIESHIKTYEVDRPDDPVHSFNPRGNGNGHHYIIRFGEDYRGWYGITTDELSCGDVPGICPERM